MTFSKFCQNPKKDCRQPGEIRTHTVDKELWFCWWCWVEIWKRGGKT